MTHIGTRPLETERLVLRRLTMGDAGAFFDIMHDERVTRWLLFPRLLDVSQSEALLEKDMALYEDEPNFYLWAIEEKATGAMVGTISLSVANEASAVGTTGYSVAPALWGRGYAPEALRAVLDFAFHQVGFNRVEAHHSTQNPNSGKVLRKAGMLYEGMAREKYRNHLGHHDAHLYGMLKRDF